MHPPHHHPSPHRSSIITSLCLSLLVLSSVVSAIAPAPVSFMSYITVDENTLYVQGGIDPSDTDTASLSTKSKQLFSLNLTTPTTWNTTVTSSIPWTQLNINGDSGPATHGHSLSFVPKPRSITVWDPSATNTSIMSYSLDTNKWTKVADRPQGLTTQPGIQAVAHPTNGQIYIPSGRNITDGDMLIFDLQTQTTTWAPMPPREPSTDFQWYGYSFVWSSYWNSFIIFGGGGDVAPYFYEYKVKDNYWSELALVGNIPPRLKHACLTPAYNGTKMILFGGLTSTGIAARNLYTLDVRSLTWNLTATAPSSQSRYGMACSVSGDNFIIWGGQTTGGTVMSGTPLIYNINTADWSTKFTRGTHFTPTGPLTAQPTDIPRESGSRSPSSTDIGGAIVAGVAVVAFVGFLFYRRRKRQRALKNGGLFAQMPESDMSLTHIVSPPPPGAVTPGQGDFTELNSSSHVGHQRLHGSHSNAQPISLAQRQVGGSNNSLGNNNYNDNTMYNINDDLDSRLSPFPPISTTHHPDPSWITPPQNPDWPTSPQLSRPPLHQQMSPSPSSSTSWAATLAAPNSPSAPPPPYLPSGTSAPLVVFRKEAATEPVSVPSVRKDTEPEFLSSHIYTISNSNNNNSSSSSSGSTGGYAYHERHVEEPQHQLQARKEVLNTGGYAYHERQVEELQHQLAARKEELVRRNSGHRPQYYPPPPPHTGGSGGYTASKAVARSPQGAGDLVVQGTSTSSAGSSGSGTSNEELQQQVQALQAELNRLQALIGS